MVAASVISGHVVAGHVGHVVDGHVGHVVDGHVGHVVDGHVVVSVGSGVAGHPMLILLMSEIIM